MSSINIYVSMFVCQPIISVFVVFQDVNKNTRTDLKADTSNMHENKSKNRYVNITACKYDFPTMYLCIISLKVNKCLQIIPGQKKNQCIYCY